MALYDSVLNTLGGTFSQDTFDKARKRMLEKKNPAYTYATTKSEDPNSIPTAVPKTLRSMVTLNEQDVANSKKGTESMVQGLPNWLAYPIVGASKVGDVLQTLGSGIGSLAYDLGTGVTQPYGSKPKAKFQPQVQTDAPAAEIARPVQSAPQGGMAQPNVGSAPAPTGEAAPGMSLEELRKGFKLPGTGTGTDTNTNSSETTVDSGFPTGSGKTLAEYMAEATGIYGKNDLDDIISTEMQRREHVANLLGDYHGRLSDAGEVNRQERLGLIKALGAEMSGGTGNASSSSLGKFANQMTADVAERAREEKSLYDALGSLESQSQQFILQAKQDALDRAMEAGKMGISEYEAETARLAMQSDEAYKKSQASAAKTNAGLEAQKNAVDALDKLTTKYGSKYTEFIAPEDLENLLATAGYSYMTGSVPTVDELSKLKADFVAGGKYQKSGYFDPVTKEFVPLANAGQFLVDPDSSGSGGISSEQVQSLRDYINLIPTSEGRAAAVSSLPSAYEKALFGSIGQNDSLMASVIGGLGTTQYGTEPQQVIQARANALRAAGYTDDDITDWAKSQVTSYGMDPNDKSTKKFIKSLSE